MALTKRQKEVLDYLVSFETKHGYAPSFEEIGKGMKLLLAGNDLPMLTGAARAHQAKVRAMAKVRPARKAAAKK